MLTLIISKIKNSPIEIDSMFSGGPPNNDKHTQSLILPYTYTSERSINAHR